MIKYYNRKTKGYEIEKAMDCMMTYIIKGVIIGMIVSIPIGPLGIMSIQRTIDRGWETGFLSGIGAAAADIFYSSAAVFGFSFIDEFIIRHRHLINGVTGVMFLVVGLNIFISSLNDKIIRDDSKKDIIHPAFSNFLLGLSNPMTFLIFLTIFAKMKMNIDEKSILKNLMFISSIFAGSAILWLLNSNLINSFKKNFKIETFYVLDKVMGILIALFGIFSMIKGVLRV